jgi:hypothetical protein
MKLFDILKIEMPSLTPEDCKIHLASWNGRDDPLDVFLEGRFPEWQNWQSNKNFERQFIVSLIKMPSSGRWLFAGVHSSHGCTFQKVHQCYYYQTKELRAYTALTGRLIIGFPRPGRQSYLRAEKWAEQFQVLELKPRPLAVEEFPGFSNLLLPKWKLDIIVAQGIESWRSALSSVAGVYLITDAKTGRHYVGSAYGTGGIWGRWTAYAESGHGHNKNLKRLLQKRGATYSRNFQFSVLETADTNAGEDEILERETHWKNALCSRESRGGYNAN